ncbi:unnamed protein product [Staurois parvus]|uniref:Interferon-induced transmembrane protein n=1 Tax=Staurois parvus TaxID=386267 RepID=A0ABN9BMQ3_9NEOB|nr:unnamed protein product [Staurois parvus]
MDTEKPSSSLNPGEEMHNSQINYGYQPHKGEVPAYNAPAYYPPTSTVVTIIQDNSVIKDHIIWSIFSTLYMNCCCLGFAALVFSVKSRDQKLLGNRVGAKSYSDTARNLNITTTTIATLWFILMIILFASGILTFRSYNTHT